MLAKTDNRSRGPAPAAAAFRVGLLLAVLAIGPPSLAAIDPDRLISPDAPASYDIPDVRAWVEDHVVVGGYLLTGYNTNAVAFLATDEVELTGPRRVRIWLRFEHFRPTFVAGVSARSSRIKVEFDCERDLYRHLAYELYPEHNLVGTPARDATPAAAWLNERPNTAAADSAGIVCSVMEELMGSPAAGGGRGGASK